ncbi:MAG: hypothetical protein BWZ10_00035 [candidate division BRC1 bacterium ADurb.BinA364]|nr:MAG: hypothetical protein BWZ10_00035 [candidate division BRC1 bacterium ADurb.BinA364]
MANIRGEGAERSPNAKERIRDILGLPDAPPLVKAEAFEALLALTSEELLAQSRQSLGQAGVGESALREVDESLEQDLADYSQLDPQSRDSLRTAEFLFRQERQIGGDIDFSRNIGFSFCFAVENESKRCLARKLHRMLSNPQFYTIIDQLLEGPTRHLGVFFHQSLLQLQRDAPMSFSIDNVRQVFHRILEHRERYKPDGLKAIAILILCFGRTYDVRTARSRISIENPLALRGLNDDSDIILLAQRLSRLQHYRNPYIHPEISEMEAITAIRQEALACLNVIRRIG